MKIYDFAMAVPKSLTSMFFKGVRNNVDDISKEEIIKNGLYHITPSEEYEGYCKLMSDEVKKVQLVPDLVRNNETGQPIINNQTQRYDIAFREVEENYEPKEDFLKFVEEERERLGYKKKEGILNKLFNAMNAYVHESKIEMEMIGKKIKKLIQKRVEGEKTLQLEAPREDRRKKFLEELNVIGKENSEDSNIRKTTQKHIINNKEVER